MCLISKLFISLSEWKLNRLKLIWKDKKLKFIIVWLWMNNVPIWQKNVSKKVLTIWLTKNIVTTGEK